MANFGSKHWRTVICVSRCVQDVKTSLDCDGDGSITKVSKKTKTEISNILKNIQFWNNIANSFFKDEFVANAVKSKFIYNMFIAE